MSKKNKIKKETIKVMDSVEATRKAMPYYVPSFRSGKFMTEKDRPRKKVNKRNLDKWL